MRLLSVYLVLISFALSACSLSKDEKLQPKNNPIQTANKEVESRPSTQSLLLSEFHRFQKDIISKRLSKNPDTQAKTSEPSESSKNFIAKFDSLFTKISENNIGDALIELEPEKMSCEDIELSFIYTYMTKNLKDFGPYANFLNKVGCSSKSLSAKIFDIYLLESKRQFHTKFSDKSLLKYLLHHSNFKKSSMLPLSNSGISISLSFLHEVSLTCAFRPDLMGKISKDGYEVDFVGCDGFFNGNEDNGREPWEEVKIHFLAELNLSSEEFDVTYIKNGRLIAAAPSFRIIQNEVLDGFPSQITMYMNGFWDSPEKWEQSLADILRPNLMEGM